VVAIAVEVVTAIVTVYVVAEVVRVASEPLAGLSLKLRTQAGAAVFDYQKLVYYPV
jgi:hypothetical protein